MYLYSIITPQLSALGLSEPGLSYQWRFNGTNLADATNALFEIPDTSTDQSGLYDVIISELIPHRNQFGRYPKCSGAPS